MPKNVRAFLMLGASVAAWNVIFHMLPIPAEYKKYLNPAG